MKIIEKFKGYKSYIVACLGIIVVALSILDILSETQSVTILSALGVGGLVTLRLAISEILKQVTKSE